MNWIETARGTTSTRNLVGRHLVETFWPYSQAPSVHSIYSVLTGTGCTQTAARAATPCTTVKLKSSESKGKTFSQHFTSGISFQIPFSESMRILLWISKVIFIYFEITNRQTTVPTRKLVPQNCWAIRNVIVN